ncbi:MAG: LPS export ABC transporter permease LptF [Methyloceanibacter sp.]|jgi:lipopolysaccharide export system permease protein|uniref:LPS export ABC transporter permease LptF n=1 Tax=Methyloceanibacter sp. TaxID=1965321 RepID=UPI003C78D2C3
MTLFSRYVFRQVANAFVIILVTLTTIVWLATALKQLDLIISQGQGFVLFLKMTVLSLPGLMALIAPNAMLMASLYTLDRMNGDSELIVMTAAGAPVWRIGAPFVVLASMVCVVILICNLWVMPASMRALRALITQVRTDVISQVLQPGRFSSTEPGLTFHIRDRSPTGDLLGLLVHDERDDKLVMSYLAERGRIISNDDGAYLVMFDGHVHRYEVKDPSKGVQIVAFDQYVLNISDFSPKDTSSKELRPRERYLSELLNPDPNLLKNKGASGQLRTELHDRFSTPFYPLLFAFLAVAVLGHARTTRESRWAQILVAAGIAVGLRVSGLTASNLVTLSAGATPLVYVIPIGAIIVAALVAHVRMSPELRSKLSLQLKFVPDNIKFWTGRGIVAK